MWHFSKDGIYLVKSGYLLGSSVFLARPLKSFWQKLWKLQEWIKRQYICPKILFHLFIFM